MFAVNRTDKVIGRISLLINSITTIKGSKKEGAPLGTKCANIKFGVLIHLKIIKPNQRGIVIERFIDKCLDGVKT
jgi:hypothetical protein